MKLHHLYVDYELSVYYVYLCINLMIQFLNTDVVVTAQCCKCLLLIDVDLLSRLL